MGKLRGGHQCRVEDANAMVHLVALLQTTQDGDGVLHTGLVDDDRLETALQRSVLFDVFAIFIERRRADGTQFPASELRLEQVGGIDGTFRGAGADDGVQLVDEQDDLPLAGSYLLEERLEPVLEFAAEFRARDHGTEVHRDDALALERLGHVARDDPSRETLDDGGLAHARVSDEHGVVLRAAGKDLHDAADLVVAPDYGVNLAFARLFGEVASVLFEGLVFPLGILVGDALVAAHLL